MEAVMSKNKVKSYSSYKHSGEDWIGDVPDHWGISRLASILNAVSTKNRTDLPLLSITREKGVIIRDTENDEENHNYIPDDLSNYKFLPKGYFGMNKMKAWQGSYGISEQDGIVSPAYFIFKLREDINARFFHLAIRSKLYIEYFGSASDGVRVGQWDLSKPRMKNIPFLIPPLKEQTAIAEFLDKKTALIDQAISIKEKQIELLKERKQILIQKAVTRGLNSKVKLKDSGVEWIGEIPEHWEVKRFRYLFSLGKGLTITKENLQDEGVYCVNYGEIHSKFGFEVNPQIHELKCVSTEYLKTDSNSLLRFGDFIFADTSEDIEGSGNFTYLNSNEITFAGYHTVIARKNFNFLSRFLAYVFDSVSFRNQIRVKVKGVKVYSITQSILKEPFVWLPPQNEQKGIVDYLDRKIEEIQQSIVLKVKEIEKLKEYKSTLINSAVTGKIKVC